MLDMNKWCAHGGCEYAYACAEANLQGNRVEVGVTCALCCRCSRMLDDAADLAQVCAVGSLSRWEWLMSVRSGIQARMCLLYKQKNEKIEKSGAARMHTHTDTPTHTRFCLICGNW